ncbi:2,3-diketo-L-gulonate reductase [Candidatus Epulonipiscium fishelsonii]|nr:2,3-diketo-L-gulonate reductase [Epulopiscium sp. SCG-C06WGA-EpuloA1]
MKIQYLDMLHQFEKVLLSRGFNENDAKGAATIFAQNSLDGVYSHGTNRFIRAIENIDKGLVNPNAGPTCEMSFGAIEKWDGHQGFGPLGAKKAMDKACSIANNFGVGIVALGNNNHWMRGGTYGLQACDQGCIAICWSNTMPNMPAWGGVERKIGNNPLILAVPRSNGEHIMVDCAMSQFSYGKMEETKLRGEQLPVYGGYDTKGNLTTDPMEIEKSWRTLPMGYWKGSGISILLDLITKILTNANSVAEIGRLSEEVGLSQVMIAIDPKHLTSQYEIDKIIEDFIADLKTSTPIDKDVFYPSERSINTRKKNTLEGIPVNQEIWNKILSL